MAPKHILVTGGTGFIGSHVCLHLLLQGYRVLILDDLSNSDARALSKIERLTNRQVDFVEGDIRDESLLTWLFSQSGFSAVMHLAGMKAGQDAAGDPLAYYDVNVCGSTRLINAMRNGGCRSVIFSSSSAVCGDVSLRPFAEKSPAAQAHFYARTALAVENLLADVCASEGGWKAICLRYINPVGADYGGMPAECLPKTPSNLLPLAAQAAPGATDKLQILEHDYYPANGRNSASNCVTDVALAHIAAVKLALNKSAAQFKAMSQSGWLALNLGMGSAHGLEVAEMWVRGAGKSIPRETSGKRAADAPHLIGI